MAKMTKLVHKHVPAFQRYQIFSNTENNDDGNPVAAGDTIDIQTSLGRPAREIQITVNGASNLGIRYNTEKTIYGHHDPVETTGVFGSDFYDNLADPKNIVYEQTELTVGTGTARTITLTGPIVDILIETFSLGTWTIYAY